MAKKKKRTEDTWLGYVRDDGKVGCRNHVLLLAGTLYAAPPAST